MRYVEIGKFGSVWGKRTASPTATVSALASRTSLDPTVVLSISVFEDTGSDIEVDSLVGAASIELPAETVRRFAERLLRSADEAEERARRLVYAEEVKEVLS
jgi:hypothetical protein